MTRPMDIDPDRLLMTGCMTGIARRILRKVMEGPASYAVALAWWLCFRPGFYSADSFGALGEASSGHISAAYTAVWPLFLRMVTLEGRFPGIATLIDGLLLVYALGVWCRAALPPRAARFTPVLMAATPLVGAIGITLWHDVPMTSGLLLLAGIATSTNWFSSRATRTDGVHLVGASVLCAFRPNGMPTLVGFFALAVALRCNPRRTALMGLVAALTALAVSLGAAAATGSTSLFSAPFAQEWMRADVSCALSRDVSLVKAGDRGRLSTFTGFDGWANSAACVSMNRLPLDAQQLKQSLEVIPGIWFNLARAHPFTMLGVHAYRNAYLLPWPRLRALDTPFIHSTIEFPDRGISWANPRLAERARNYVRAWNAARGLLAYAGFWLVVLTGLAMTRSARRSSLAMGPTVILSLSLMALLFVTAPIPDARYALFVLVTGESALLGALWEFFHA
jgi:hypothetical protein